MAPDLVLQMDFGSEAPMEVRQDSISTPSHQLVYEAAHPPAEGQREYERGLGPSSSPMVLATAQLAGRIQRQRAERLQGGIQGMVLSVSAYEAELQAYAKTLRQRVPGLYVEAAQVAKATGQTEQMVISKAMNPSIKDPALDAIRKTLAVAEEDPELSRQRFSLLMMAGRFKRAAEDVVHLLGLMECGAPTGFSYPGKIRQSITDDIVRRLARLEMRQGLLFVGLDGATSRMKDGCSRLMRAFVEPVVVTGSTLTAATSVRR